MRGRIHGSRTRRVALVFLAVVATVLGLAPSASAAYAVEPTGPAWVPNGGVHAVVTDGSTVYVGGAFTGGVAALDASTGELRWLGSANADVRALALNGGQLLLGGAFSTVGGATHRGIASVSTSTGAVNTTFKGAAGGTVRDIVVVGTTAYFAGAFTSHGGMTQTGLGAVNAATGDLVRSFSASANGNVYALGTDGTRLFIGGKFTAINGQTRNELASVTLATNALDAWAPAMACPVDCNVVWDLTVGGNRVYTVGRNSGTLYTLDKTTGAELFRAPRPNGDSQAVALSPDGRTAYVGGHFVSLAGVTRMLVAEFDVSGSKPVLGQFSTRFVTSYPGVWALASTSSFLYVGGDFTAAGSQVNGKNVHQYFAMFPSSSTPPAETTPPTVTGTSPLANATSVPVSGNVTATFSEPVQGVSGTTFTVTPTAGGAAVDAAVSQGTGNQWILNPTTDLAAGTQYTAALTGSATTIRDMANNPLRSTSWSFTTAAATTPTDITAPTWTGRIPAANNATGFSRTANVTIAFSEPVTNVTPTTFTLVPTVAGSPVVPATVTFNSTSGRWVLNPNSTLDANTQYTATVTSDVTDLATPPNHFAGVTWNFTTGA